MTTDASTTSPFEWPANPGVVTIGIQKVGKVLSVIAMFDADKSVAAHRSDRRARATRGQHTWLYLPNDAMNVMGLVQAVADEAVQAGSTRVLYAESVRLYQEGLL